MFPPRSGLCQHGVDKSLLQHASTMHRGFVLRASLLRRQDIRKQHVDGVHPKSLDRSLRSFTTSNPNLTSPITLFHDGLTAAHTLSGYNWSTIIPLATLCLSLVTLPLAVRARQNTIKIIALKPILAAHSASIAGSIRRRTTSSKEFEKELKASVSKKRKETHARHNVDLAALLMLPAIKVPIWLSFSMALRSMSGLQIPYFASPGAIDSMQYEGITSWWCADLTSTDNFMVLPVLFGVLNLVNIEFSASQHATRGVLGKTIELVGRIISVIFISISAQMPAAVCLYWVSSSFFTLLQNIGLNYIYPITAGSRHEIDTKIPSRLVLPGVDDPLPTRDNLPSDSTADTSMHESVIADPASESKGTDLRGENASKGHSSM